MRKSNRRGVLLLVVLALLAMFAMVAVAFVVLTNVEKQTSNRFHDIDTQAVSPQKDLDGAMAVVIRGVPCTPQTVPTSAIKWHSLLEKIDGFYTIGMPDSSAIGVGPPQSTSAMLQGLSQSSLVCNGQLIEFTLPKTNPNPIFNGMTVDPFHCVGCVLTMLDGPNAGLSTRIVGINPQTLNVQMAAFEGGVLPSASNSFLNGNHYIVNGFPYSGMGFGFSSTSGGLTQLGSSSIPLALLPNAPPSAWGAANGIIPGGVNGDYTAPDNQDPLLALAVTNSSQSGMFVPIPSLHRSDLIAYLNAQSNILGNAAILRQVMFRPNSLDHPNFTGSNPNFNPLWDGITPGQGQWDVDNDGDGIPDSVWVDLGMPVRSTADGRTYKPLFAILCLDMDGRLNLNAHSSLAQAQPSYYQQMINGQPAISLQAYQSVLPSHATLDTGLGMTVSTTASFAGPAGSRVTAATVSLPRGQGSGPAEVSLLPLFRVPGAPGSFNWPNYQALLSGIAGSPGTMGRYGQPAGSALPGFMAGAGTGTPGALLTFNRAFPFNGVMGGNYWTNFGTIYDSHGSPSDYQTFGAIGLDHSGRPLYISMGGPVANGPYDLDLTLNAPHAVDQSTVDNPFGVAEFERILRWPDRDSISLPQRLYNLTNSGSGSLLQSRRAEVTVESEWVPTASAVLPPALRWQLPGRQSQHPVDLIYAKLPNANASSTATNPQLIAPYAAQLLPWELLQGLKMDLNRPFGAGAFSTRAPYQGQLIWGGQTTIPDQPGTSNEKLLQYVTASGQTVTATVNYAADGGVLTKVNGTSVSDSLAARQLYARHLYVLALAVSDTGALLADLQKTSPATPDDVTRMLAQWAVNVVAYRDHNSVMIPFPYDTNPFSGNGWNPDNTPLHTVWGCKRPELLITETLAFHDVRTQDLNTEIFDKNKHGPNGAPPNAARTEAGLSTDTGKKKDPGFNSKFRPQGSLFVELYNPWSALEPRTVDLGAVNGSGVELTKRTPTVGGKVSPVWRLVIVSPTPAPPAQGTPTQQPNGDDTPDPDNPIVAQRPTIERAAYFINTSGMTTPGDGQVSYYPSNANARSIIVSPSGYAVVGSGDPNQQNRTFVGFENGKTAGSPSTTRMVTLNPGDLADARVVRNTNDPALPPGIPKPQVLGIDSPQRLSVSEPVKGYAQFEVAANGKQANYTASTGQYDITLDVPVDQQRDPTMGGKGTESGIWPMLDGNTTVPAFRIIYLQRLADPTRPWAADTSGNNPRQWNPYRTVDMMTVDLTTFNGLTSTAEPTPPTPAPLARNGWHFEAHQRGEKNYYYQPGVTLTTSGQPGEVDLWKQEPANKMALGLAAAQAWTGGGATPKGTHYFAQPLNQTLGFLNQPFGQPAATPSQPGDSQYPFPWLNWSYRPFNNEYELLLVPALSSSRLLARNKLDPRRYYNYVDKATRATFSASSLTVYDPAANAQLSLQRAYPHLLDFFESGKSSATGLTSQLHRVLAYVGVPSRFANTQIQLQPFLAGGPDGPMNWFHTPFNRISRYREPGRINLNTLTSSDVLMGAMNMYFTPLVQNSELNPVFWDKFVRSRRGDGGGNPVRSAAGAAAAQEAQQTQQSLTNMLTINPQVSSRFMRPYRTPGGAYLTAPALNGQSAEPARETDVTLLRADPDIVKNGVTVRPLLESDDYLFGGTPNTLSSNAATPDQFPMACMDFNRNPHFRYQALQKLGGVFSNHSNVFAVWITVGYFEVTPATNPNLKDAYGNPVYPDGYQLGPELGIDTGDVVRHRAFYMFDRSIPVGFIRGKDINQQKALLISRIIE
jgi:hypothetical protein